MPAGRYFGAFIAIVAILYGLIYFTGTDRTPQLGLDLRGGTTVTLTARTPDGQAPAQQDLELARQIIEQRVNGLGVAEAEVVTEGDSNIVISVPGDDGEQARELGATAQPRFRPAIGSPQPAGPAATQTPETSAPATPTAGAPATPSPEAPDAPTPPAEPTDAATPTDAAAPTGTATPAEGSSGPAAPEPGSPPVTEEEAAAQFATLTCE